MPHSRCGPPSGERATYAPGPTTATFRRHRSYVAVAAAPQASVAFHFSPAVHGLSMWACDSPRIKGRLAYVPRDLASCPSHQVSLVWTLIS